MIITVTVMMALMSQGHVCDAAVLSDYPCPAQLNTWPPPPTHAPQLHAPMAHSTA